MIRFEQTETSEDIQRRQKILESRAKEQQAEEAKSFVPIKAPTQYLQDNAKTGFMPQYQKTPEFVRSNVGEQLDFASSIDKQKQLYEENLKKQREIDQRINDKMLFSNITGALLGDKAGQAVRKVEEPVQNLMETTRNAFDFGIGGTIGSFIDPMGYEARKQLQERNPMTSTAGNVIGSLQLGAIVEQGVLKALKPLATKELSEVAGKDIVKRAGMNTLKTATSAGLAGAGYGAIEGTMKGIADRKSLPEIAKEAGTTAGMYGLGGAVLGGGIGAIGQTIKGANVALNQSLDNMFSGYRPSVEGFAPVTPPKYIPANMEGKFTYKAPTQEIQGEILQRVPATLKRPNVPQPEVLGLPAPVYRQPPVKPIKLGESPQGIFTVKDMNKNSFIPQRVTKVPEIGLKEFAIKKGYDPKMMANDYNYAEFYGGVLGQKTKASKGKWLSNAKKIDYTQKINNEYNQAIKNGEVKMINKYEKLNPNSNSADSAYVRMEIKRAEKRGNLELANKWRKFQETGEISINQPKISELKPQQKTLEARKQYNKQMGEYTQQSNDVRFQNKTGRVENKDFTMEQPFKATPAELSGYAKNMAEASKPFTLPRKIVGDVNILRRTPVKSTIETGNLRTKLNELQGGERVTGEYIPNDAISTGTQSGNPRLQSSRKLPDFANMTKAEHEAYYGLDKKYSAENVNRMVEDAGAKVINKVGSDDVNTIIKHYQSKYNLPEIKTTFKPNNSGKMGTTEPIYDASGNIKGYKVNINPNQSIEGRVGTLRHEIEHVIDLQSGYTPPKQGKLTMADKKKLINQTMKEGYAKRQAGEHKNYGWFESDYIRRASIKDALKEGRKVSQEILYEFPDLKNIKPSKASQPKTDNAQAEIRPSNNTGNINSPSSNKTPLKNDSTRSNNINEQSIGGTEGNGNIRERGYAKNERTNVNSDKALQENLTSKKLEYMQLGNKDTYSRAKQIFDEGYDNALSQFNSIDKYRPHDVPLAHMIANEAAKRGDIETARNVIAKISEKLTEAGQFGQAGRIMRRSDPATFYRYIDRQINKLNDEIVARYGTKFKQVKLSDDTIKEIYNLEIIDENSMQKLMNRVNSEVTEQMPVGAWEKLDSWRKMSMLLNPLTWIRNTVGNAFMTPLRKTSDTIGMVMEKMFLKEGERSKAILWSKDDNLVDAVNKDWLNVKDDLMNNNKWSIETISGVSNTEKQIFKKGFLTRQVEKVTGTEFGKGKLAQSKLGKRLIDDEFKSGILEAMNNISRNSLNWQDEIFMGRAYRDALGQFMKSNKLSSVTETARDYAQRRALEATFRQTNELATAIARLKRTSKAGRVLDVFMPFTKTPLNIAKTGFEYSPINLVKSLFSAKSNPQQAIEGIAKGMTGSGIMTLGYLLGSYGWAKIKADKSRNVESLSQLTGEQPYSITTPIGSYTFDWNQPTALPLTMGISLAENLNRNLDPERSIPLTRAIWKSIIDTGESFVNMTVLKNFKDMLGGNYGTVTESLATLPVDFLSQMIPSVSGQISRSIDDTQRNTYDPNVFKQILNGLINKTPLSSTLPAKVNILGDEVKNAPVWQQFFSPGKTKTNVDSELVNELDRLYEEKKNSEFLPKNFVKTFKLEGNSIYPEGKELEEAQKQMGEANKREMQALINMKEYKDAPDDSKLRALKKIADNNYIMAKRDLLNKRGIKTVVKKSVIPVKSIRIIK